MQRLWANANYRRWFLADTSTELGAALTFFVLPLAVIGATGSPAQAGIVGAVGAIVRAFSDVLGGTIADRGNRFRILWLTSILGIGFSGVWVLLEAGSSMGFIAFLLISVFASLRFGFVSSASTALLPQIAGEGQLGRALSANQGRDASISMLGTPIGGVLYALGGWVAALAIFIFQLLSSIASLVLLRNAPSSIGESKSAPDSPFLGFRGMMKETFAGFMWIGQRKEIMLAILAAFFVNIALKIFLTTFLYSWTLDEVNAAVIGFLPAAAGLGMLLGALVSGKLVGKFNGGILGVVSIGLITAASLSLLFGHSTTQVLIAMGLCMFVAPTFNTVLMGYLLLAVPEELLGRVNSAASLFSWIAAAAAPVIVGFSLSKSALELMLWLVVGASIGSFLSILSNRTIRTIPTEDHWKSHVQHHEASKEKP